MGGPRRETRELLTKTLGSSGIPLLDVLLTDSALTPLLFRSPSDDHSERRSGVVARELKGKHRGWSKTYVGGPGWSKNTEGQCKNTGKDQGKTGNLGEEKQSEVS